MDSTCVLDSGMLVPHKAITDRYDNHASLCIMYTVMLHKDDQISMPPIMYSKTTKLEHYNPRAVSLMSCCSFFGDHDDRDKQLNRNIQARKCSNTAAHRWPTKMAARAAANRWPRKAVKRHDPLTMFAIAQWGYLGQ